MIFFLQLFIVLGALFIGLKQGGVSLGITSSLALLCLVVGFGVVPTEPSFRVLLVIIAATTMAASLEVCGTFDLLVFWVGDLLMRYPAYLTWLSALVSYGCVFLTGTSHVIYALFPMVVRIAQRSGLPAARPLVASVIASQQAIIASPFSAASAILCESFAPDYGQATLFALLVPATLLGTAMATFAAGYLAMPMGFCRLVQLETSLHIDKKKATYGLYVVFLGMLTMLGKSILFPVKADPVYVNALILFAMSAIIAYIAPGGRLIDTDLFKVGMQAVLVLLGVSWLGNSFFQHHQVLISAWVHTHVRSSWAWGVLLFATTILTGSQGTTLTTVLPWAPVGIALLCWVPAANSFYVLPSYPTVIAARALDDTRTIYVGKWLINHSFFVPGLVGTLTTCLATHLLAYVYGL